MTVVSIVNFLLLGYDGKGRIFLMLLPELLLGFVLFVIPLFSWHQSDWELG